LSIANTDIRRGARDFIGVAKSAIAN